MRVARQWGSALLLAMSLSVGASAPCLAAAHEQLVYWPLVTDGKEYRRVSYPAEAGSLLVLADTEVVIEARLAPVAYWPITREYLADFSGRPDPVAGSVEIVDGAGEVRAIEPEPHVLWHPLGVGVGPAQLVRGAAAEELYEDYLRAARAAAEKEQQYQRIVGAHRAAVEAWLRLAAERRGQDMPAPPPELDVKPPEPYHAYATEPRVAAVVALPEGAYTVRIRDPEGGNVPGSERELVSFAPLDRAVGYVLRPEDRWTRPVISFRPDETIYTIGQTDLFLQPVPVVEYDARRYTRLFRPQSVEVADPFRTVWVPDETRGWDGDGAVALGLWDGEALLGTLPRTPYRVAQLAGASRGYVVEEFVPEASGALEPDFQAMRLARDAEITRIGLVVDGAAGGAMRASVRQVRRVVPPSDTLLFLPALLPLVVGLALRAWRRRPGGW